VVIGASLARAQAPPPAPVPGTPQAQPREGRPADATSLAPTHRVRSVLGSTVSIQGNIVIGTVDDIIFDDDGYIDYLIVLNQGRYVTVPWQAAKFNFDQRVATVNITQQQFQQVPTFTAQTWPNFTAPTYRQQIFGYYGILPGRERRIERREGIRP
jgi:hypothetical protein